MNNVAQGSHSELGLPVVTVEDNDKTKHLKSCIYQFYSCVNLKIIFQNTCRIKSFFPYKDQIRQVF